MLGEHLHRTQKAIKTVQLCLRSWRRKRLFGNTTIPLVRGPLGLVMFPIYTKALTLEGVQGRGRPYTGNAFGILAPDHRLRLYAIALVGLYFQIFQGTPLLLSLLLLPVTGLNYMIYFAVTMAN